MFFYRLSNGFSLKRLAKFTCLRKIIKTEGYTFTISTYTHATLLGKKVLFLLTVQVFRPQRQSAIDEPATEGSPVAIASRNVYKLYLFVFSSIEVLMSIDKHNYSNCLRDRERETTKIISN